MMARSAYSYQRELLLGRWSLSRCIEASIPVLVVVNESPIDDG